MELGKPKGPTEASPGSPELQRIFGLIREGKLKEAETSLLAFIDTRPPTSDVVRAYSHLSRIAAELRSFEKISGYVDQVKKLPVETREEKLRFAYFLQATGTSWGYADNIEKEKLHYTQSLQIAEEIDDAELIFSDRYWLVEVARREGQYNTVLEQIESLRVAADVSGKPGNVGLVWLLEGNVYRKQGNYADAITAFDRARELFSANKNGEHYHYTLWALGTCYAALEDKEKATIYLDLASHNDQAQNIEFWRINVMSQLTLAELYTVVGDYNRADALYQKIADQTGLDENSYYGRRVLRGKTLLGIKQGEFEMANEYIDRLVIVALRERNQGEIMRLRLLKAEVLLRNGEAAQHDEARAMLQEALAYYRERKVLRHQAVCLELLGRLDASSGYPADAFRKVEEMLSLAQGAGYDRLIVRGQLAAMVLRRKLGKISPPESTEQTLARINRLNAVAERVILSRFTAESYDAWTSELGRLDANAQRYVNEFFEDFHFVPSQTTDVEIDQNSHYVREKHLGEIPFHNKFTLMKILCLLAEVPGREFSKEQLAKEIWGQEYNPLRHDNNIYININRLRKLIEPNPRESRYVMNGSRGYYFNPAMKVNISSKISDVAPRIQAKKPLGEGPRP